MFLRKREKTTDNTQALRIRSIHFLTLAVSVFDSINQKMFKSWENKKNQKKGKGGGQSLTTLRNPLKENTSNASLTSLFPLKLEPGCHTSRVGSVTSSTRGDHANARISELERKIVELQGAMQEMADNMATLSAIMSEMNQKMK